MVSIEIGLEMARRPDLEVRPGWQPQALPQHYTEKLLATAENIIDYYAVL